MQCNTMCQDSATAITKLWTIWYLIAYLLISNTDDKISLFPIQRCLLLQSLVRKWRCVVRTRSTFSRSVTVMVSSPNLSRERGTTMFVADRSALWDARSNKLYYFLNFFKNFLELYNKYFAIHNYIWLVWREKPSDTPILAVCMLRRVVCWWRPDERSCWNWMRWLLEWFNCRGRLQRTTSQLRFPLWYPAIRELVQNKMTGY